MGKEKNYNPVQAAKKAEKQKQLKKQKANLQAQRNEKLARRNPARLQRDIDELKAREQSGDIRPHDRQRLAQLEKDVAAIRKARETLGDNAPQFGRERGNEGGDRGGSGRGRGRGGGILGKRRRDGGWKGRDGEESSETDEDVKDIPMPRDTPPPIPRWHRNTHPGDSIEAPPESKKPTIVYEAAPEVRDLRKEATKFMPAAVQQKMRLVRGEVEGRLLEPEELDKLEKEGYMAAEKAVDAAEKEAKYGMRAVEGDNIDAYLEAAEAELLGDSKRLRADGIIAENAVEAAAQEAEHGMMTAEASGEMKNLESEGAQTERKLRHVEIEEVEDEDW